MILCLKSFIHPRGGAELLHQPESFIQDMSLCWLIWVEIQGAEPPTGKSLMTEICVKLIFFQMILSMNSERHLVELGGSAYECLQILFLPASYHAE